MPRGENRASLLLSREENDQVFSLIGPKCQSLATAVVQLFTTEDPSHSRWRKKDTGVLCLIKDNGKRSYFFRIYCLYRKAMIWEQEVYLQIEYKNPRPFLHTFEAEEYMAAFNFANENEANILRNILLEKIELRKIRREERRQRSMVPRQNGTLPPPPPEPEPAPPPTPAPVPVLQPLPPKTNNSLGSYTLKSNKKQKARKLTKADIGMPQNFKHVSHVGWDANKGFDLDNAPNADELRSFFTKAGVSETQLQDQETRAFIYDFIEMHGGLPAVKQDLDNVSKTSSRGALPPAPSQAAPAPPVPTRSPAPPHPPAPPSRAPPPPPARNVPPPPAHRTAPPRPAQREYLCCESATAHLCDALPRLRTNRRCLVGRRQCRRRPRQARPRRLQLPRPPRRPRRRRPPRPRRRPRWRPSRRSRRPTPTPRRRRQTPGRLSWRAFAQAGNRYGAWSLWLSQPSLKTAEVIYSARSDKASSCDRCRGRAAARARAREGARARGGRAAAAAWPRRCSARWRSARAPYTPTPTPTCPTPPATASGTTDTRAHTHTNTKPS